MINRTTLEIIAPTLEDAIEKGLAELGLQQNDVDVEILDEGSRGLFGLGSRQARIRLTIKAEADGDELAQELYEPELVEPAEKNEPMRGAGAGKATEGEKSSKAPAASDAPRKAKGDAAAVPSADDELFVAQDTVGELLERMSIIARVTARYGEVDEGRNRAPILVEIQGDDLSILIGRRAETLNALQYISSLMISKELGHAITLVIDVEGYRERRQNQIRQLARRMADQAIKTGRRQILEPMPASERRIIHIELRENPSVRTESTGEDPHRKVVIIPED